MMTIGGLNHKLEWMLRGASRTTAASGFVDLQDNGRSCRRNAWNQKATAIGVPVAVIHQPFIQCDRFIYPKDFILNGKKSDAVTMRKIGERSAIGRKTPVVNDATGSKKFANRVRARDRKRKK